MPSYSVGQPYNPARTSWPEAAEYRYDQSGHQLLAFLLAPSAEEIEAFRTGETHFGLFVSGQVLWLLSRFGSLNWMDHPFSWHLVPESTRAVPGDLADSERDTLTTFLVSAEDGIVRAIRQVSWSPHFSRAVRAAIQEQAAAPFVGSVPYERTIEAVYARHETKSMVARAVAKCRGGE